MHQKWIVKMACKKGLKYLIKYHGFPVKSNNFHMKRLFVFSMTNHIIKRIGISRTYCNFEYNTEIVK